MMNNRKYSIAVIALMALAPVPNALSQTEAPWLQEYLQISRYRITSCDDRAPHDLIAAFSLKYEFGDRLQKIPEVSAIVNRPNILIADRYFGIGCFAVAEQLYYEAISNGADGTDLNTAQAGLARSLAGRR
ncbi:MAG: hypothetical protein NW203_14375 [Hyphomonadaceae bacterium]|nr:hypothetical protein [Hyphomonadaceae bacterium]